MKLNFEFKLSLMKLHIQGVSSTNVLESSGEKNDFPSSSQFLPVSHTTPQANLT